MTLPFKQKDIYLGLAEISGLLRIADDKLEIEYQVKDTTLGFLDSSVKLCRIPLSIIDSVEVEKKWFTGKFELTFNRIPDLDNPFRLESNRLELSVKNKDLEKAKSFRSKLMFEILERKIDHLDEENGPAIQEKKSFTGNHDQHHKSRPRPSFYRRKSGGDGLENMLRDE